MWRRTWFLAPLCVGWLFVASPPAPAGAVPLKPLRVLADGACGGGAPHVRRVVLIARQSVRRDVGPYSVELPGYASPAQGGPDSYAPFRIAACAGDTISLRLSNALTGASQPTNLHTHGLITPPKPDLPGPAGDYVFTSVEPGHSEEFNFPIPATLPGDEFGRSAAPGPYPPGIDWFHSHIHTLAERQVRGGLAGVLTVGNAYDSVLKNGGDPARFHPKVRYLALQDIQLATKSPLTAGSPHAGERAIWINGDQKIDQDNSLDYDSEACSADQSPWSVDGACGHGGISLADYPGFTNLAWLFTINGQLDPDIDIAPGRAELWRIANLSSDVTYTLEINPSASSQSGGDALTFYALTLDGVVAGSPEEGGPGELVGVPLQHLLLMPGSRAEIYLPAQTCPVAAVLTTAGLKTGPDGDPWPAITLAHLKTSGTGDCPGMPHHAAPLAAPASGGAARVVASRPAELQVRLSARLTNFSQSRPGASARMMLRAAAPAGTAAATVDPEAALQALHPGCRFLPTNSVTASYHRRITFAQTDDDFRLGSEIVDADGNVVAPGQSIAPQTFPDNLDWQTTPHVCPVFGSQEVWELVNTTNEMHNFHIHQSKFRLADDRLDASAPHGLRAIVAAGPSCDAAGFRAAFCDPTNLIGSKLPEGPGSSPSVGVDVWHDTIPVPPQDSQGHPGRVFVSIPFKAPQQIGRFVFHCHILEHEDGGMMAPVEVLDAQALETPQASEKVSMDMMHHN